MVMISSLQFAIISFHLQFGSSLVAKVDSNKKKGTMNNENARRFIVVYGEHSVRRDLFAFIAFHPY